MMIFRDILVSETMTDNLKRGSQRLNDPPKAGNQFFLAKIQAKYIGSGSDTIDGSYRLRALGPSSIEI